MQSNVLKIVNKYFPTVPTQTILSFIYMILQDFFMFSGSVVLEARDVKRWDFTFFFHFDRLS